MQFEPYEYAEQLGIQVLHRPIRSAHGLWIPEHKTIVIRTGLRAIHDRVALTHELGHAMMGHQDDRPKHELQADLFAASKLIDPRKLARLSYCQENAAELAAELGVTQRLLHVYFRHCGTY